MQRTRWWLGRPMTRGQGLTLALILVLVTVTFGHYLDHRRAVSDIRQIASTKSQHRLNQRQDRLNAKYNRASRSICTVLNGIPHTPPIRPLSERRAINKAYRVNHCRPLPQPTPAAPTPSSSPPASSTVAPAPTSTTVVIRPTPRVTHTTVRPHPTATVTKHPKPTPSKSCLVSALGLCVR